MATTATNDRGAVRRWLRAMDRTVAPWLRPLLLRFPSLMRRLQRMRRRVVGAPAAHEGERAPGDDLPDDGQPGIRLAWPAEGATIDGACVLAGEATTGSARPTAIRWRWSTSDGAAHDARCGPWWTGVGAHVATTDATQRPPRTGFAIPLDESRLPPDGPATLHIEVADAEPPFASSHQLVVRRRPDPRDVSRGLPFGVNITGHIHSEKGVGESVRASVRMFDAVDVPTRVIDFRDPGSHNLDRSVRAATPADPPFAVDLLHLNADLLPASIRGERLRRERLTIAYWAWELPSFPLVWCDRFAMVDEVWVPSRFVRDALLPVSPVPVTVIPPCLAPMPVTPDECAAERRRAGIPPGARLVLTMFDFHSVMQRKDPLASIEAFRQAFADRDDVHLLLKTSRGHDVPDAYAMVEAAARNVPRVHLMDRVLPRQNLIALVASCDVLLSLHRSEGFGLGLAEAMAARVPVVATGWSGSEDIVSDATALRVDSRLVEIEHDHGPYRAGAIWAEPDVAHAASLMRDVFDRPDATAGRVARGYDDVTRRFAPATVGQAARARLVERLGRDA
ncbi:MAG: glycosyltransferase family 4 protein [Planctomycetota bacterium]